MVLTSARAPLGIPCQPISLSMTGSGVASISPGKEPCTRSEEVSLWFIPDGNVPEIAQYWLLFP